MPTLRHTSGTGVPSSAWRKQKATCSGLYPGFLHGMILLLMCDHPTKLAFWLDQFSGGRSKTSMVAFSCSFLTGAVAIPSH